MADMRETVEVLTARPTLEGAGVRLRRAFGFGEVPRFDPFLMLDDFRGDRPEDYLAGFPWYPHRGMETVTYMLEGRIEHGDSMGHAGTVEGGGVQWMTAGSGILHQEMPKPVDGRMGGFQVWVNLPAAQKMMDPRYQEVAGDAIPVVHGGGATVRVVAGEHGGAHGPVTGIVAAPTFLDVALQPGAVFEHRTDPALAAFAYVFSGTAAFGEGGTTVENAHAVRLGPGNLVRAEAGPDGARFLLIAGRPIGEPVAWRGPVVMNTDGELREAFRELNEGTFVKKRG
ncbi:pirin family protein [Methanoculleus sp.]|uniref:pirin family protein n=1 Tax=Methanoculleus sp. TaxID=90427 RepID=UPI002FC75335